MAFLSNSKIVSTSQFNFRHHLNTVSAIACLLKNAVSLVESGDFSLGLFCDLSSPFDVIGHQILVHNYSNMTLRVNLMIDGTVTYLTICIQYVEI